MHHESRNCQSCQQNFTIEPDDFAFYEKIKVPLPTWCPECGFAAKMLWRNEKALYWGQCELCKTKTISMYPVGAQFPVYCHSCFISDKWDPTKYGVPYDFAKPFFTQFLSVLKTTPRVAILQYGTSVNCEFANYTRNTKNAYLAYGISTGESIYYSNIVDWSKDVLDSLMSKNSELLYEGFNSDHCYKSQFIVNSRDCTDSYYLYDCVNCQNCFMSANLRNKQYVFCNEQLSKGAYEKSISGINLGSARGRAKLLNDFKDLEACSIHKYADISKAVNCTGNYILNCKNVRNSFDAYDVENASWVVRVLKAKDVHRVFSCGEGSELVYDGIVGGKGTSNVKFFASADVLRGSQYTDWCSSSHNLFGCVGMKNKQYCILNKQYTKEEYEELVPRIIEHMNTMPYVDKQGRVYRYGEFFPPELSPFAYNETIAQEYFPLSEAEAKSKGYRWKNPDLKQYTITKRPEDLPDYIKDVTDEVLNETIGCAHEGKCTHQCTTAFKVIGEELAFYRRMNLPIPRLCPNCRHYERLKQRNPLKLWKRKCQCAGKGSENGIYKNTVHHTHGGEKCPNEFETSYAPDRKEIIYCESCYNAEVV
ncbi:MAG: hypothetical protein V1696_03745 [Candidatus Jorgensenbacteria bacterium]